MSGASSSHPETIGRFVIESVLGRGAMGVVYKAHDPDIDRPVAVKLIRADLLEGDDREKYIKRFRNEARIAGRLTHASIIAIFDVSIQDGNPFIVMEYADCVPLGKAFRREAPASTPEVVRLAAAVLDALDYAHGFGVVHRDIKPANLLLTSNGRVKIADFGISRFVSSDLTVDPVMIGTPSYMSPEQCRGEPVDSRSDLFSLGCVLYELLTGARPFAGRDYTSTLHRLMYEPHEKLVERRPDLPASLSAAVDRALQKHPDDRFGSAQEMMQAIQAYAFQGVGVETAEPVIGIEQAAQPGEIDRRVIDTASFRSFSGFGVTGSSVAGAIVPGSSRDQLNDAALAKAVKALASILGPVAHALVARARVRAATIGELHVICEEWLDNPPERERFRAALSDAVQ